ncbi:DNA polymerase IV [uncultured Clostridium sp.]|uniref:Y-family DNA polymerase n=1 Tax=uncultured Clostridium sp. TaxID=59620 RepID=UPI0025FE23C6|nr:DNA polymerase IV [uncultured Clostridium sp.]
MKRVIFHVDVNSAFLSWEACYRLHHLGGKQDLREIVSAVGGDQEKRHGIILAKSIPAKKYHIQTGETVVSAKQKCPELVLVPPNYDLYNRSSKALIRMLGDYTDRIEQYSIDEAFLDMTGCCSDPEEKAHEMRKRIRNELGFTVNIGISENKLLAKMASDFAKPDRVHTLWRHEIPKKMWPLSVGDLFYVGHASLKKLSNLGIRTIGELAAMDPALLRGNMKSHGQLIWQYANGLDDSPVIDILPAAKGYGNSLTTPQDVQDPELAKKYLLSLSETVSARLRADGVKISMVSISLRDWDLRFYGHQITLSVPTDLTIEIYRAVCRCFDEVWDGIPLRHLGIHTGRVSRGDFRQIQMFDKVDYEKARKLECAVDSIRKRYGMDSIKRACFISSPGKAEIDHMGGGISREKRTVDYTKERVL